MPDLRLAAALMASFQFLLPKQLAFFSQTRLPSVTVPLGTPGKFTDQAIDAIIMKQTTIPITAVLFLFICFSSSGLFTCSYGLQHTCQELFE
jgi:hypothetical protein